MSSTRLNVKNKHVSNNTLSRAERCQIAQLTVKLEKKSHGHYSAAVWKYFGQPIMRVILRFELGLLNM